MKPNEIHIRMLFESENSKTIKDECTVIRLGHAVRIAEEIYEQAIEERNVIPENATIAGIPIDEAITILNAVKLERYTDIKMTMENLHKYMKCIEKELQESLSKSLEDMMSRGDKDETK